MAISQSIGGQIGSALWRRNPLLGLGLAFGTGAGLYAAAHTFAATDGTAKDKSVAAGQSGARFMALGGLAMTTGLMGLNLMAANPGWTSRNSARLARWTVTGAPKSAGSYFSNLYRAGAAGKSGVRSVAGGVGRVFEGKLLGIGLGSAIGAAIGANLDPNDPGHGARRGALIGAGGGLAVSLGLRASRGWKTLPGVGKAGAIGVLSAAVFAATSMASRPGYAQMDQAVPDQSSLRSRMDSMSAGGDIVFGLHNSR